MTTAHKTITLAEFIERAEHGEPIEQALNDGTSLTVSVFTPTQDGVAAVQSVMARMFALSSEKGGDANERIVASVIELGMTCLRVCIKADGEHLPEAAIVSLFSKLPPQSPLMLRCQELCGATAISVPILDIAKNAAVEASKESSGKERRVKSGGDE